MSTEIHSAQATASRNVPDLHTVKRFVEILQQGQEFYYQHAEEQDFVEGFRPYALYKDLGLRKPTGGLVQAHLVRLLGECTDDVRKTHYHDTCFQMVYVLKGWEKIQAEGHEPVTMKAGSVWIQPPKINHIVLDYSDGCEVLEIILPADFDTKEV
ncbi:MAG: cupin domain-containing protein [Pseudomonadota bacterium]